MYLFNERDDLWKLNSSCANAATLHDVFPYNKLQTKTVKTTKFLLFSTALVQASPHVGHLQAKTLHKNI